LLLSLGLRAEKDATHHKKKKTEKNLTKRQGSLLMACLSNMSINNFLSFNAASTLLLESFGKFVDKRKALRKYQNCLRSHNIYLKRNIFNEM